MVRRLLFHAHVGAHYQRVKIGTPDFTANFPFVLMADGKAQRVIKPLYLAQNDTTRILNHGGQWVDRVRRLRKRNALPGDVLFPITAQQDDSKAYDAFTEIRDDLLSLHVQVVAANDEADILRFAAI